MGDFGMRAPIPVLRMYDVAATTRFYVDYLGFNLDWQEGEGDRPIYLQVSRGPVALHLSSHSGDGTPGTAVVIQVDDVVALHRELHSKKYPYMNPGIDQRGLGREVKVLDPASNEIRFFESGDAEPESAA